MREALGRLRDPWFQAHVDRVSDYGDTIMVHAAEYRGAIVGLALVDYLPKCGIVIDCKFRRMGIGRILLRHVVDHHGRVEVAPADLVGLAFFESVALELPLLRIDRSNLEA
jgi:ribosomal protein S18 acetylase RimI-like enzyme